MSTVWRRCRSQQLKAAARLDALRRHPAHGGRRDCVHHVGDIIGLTPSPKQRHVRHRFSDHRVARFVHVAFGGVEDPIDQIRARRFAVCELDDRPDVIAPEPPERARISCGGCPGYTAYCKRGRCDVKVL